VLAVWFVPFTFSLFNVPSLLLQINEGINNVRAEDASSLKASIIDYLLLDTTARLDPPIQRKGNTKKSDYGFSHPTTAPLLCPLKYDATQEYVLVSSQSFY